MAFSLFVFHIDVGQGESTLIVVRRDGVVARAVLVDGGKQQEGATVVSFTQANIGEKRLDAVVATHFDNDHIGGLSAVLATNLVDEQTVLYERCTPGERPETRDTLSYKPAADNFVGKTRRMRLGDELFGLDGGDAPRLECIAANGIAFASASAEAEEEKALTERACRELEIDPLDLDTDGAGRVEAWVQKTRAITRVELPKAEGAMDVELPKAEGAVDVELPKAEGAMDVEDKETFVRKYNFPRVRPKVDENQRSIALALVWKKFVYYTGGDLGLEIENTVGDYLASKHDHVCAFKASHHGSDHGSSPDFVRAIRPRVAFISCGRDNTFRQSHHPAQKAISTLQFGKREGDLTPDPDHAIQKYYLTNCGYHRYFVNKAPGNDSEWKFESAICQLADLEPDDDETLNPTLYDPFSKVDTESDKIVALVTGCLDALERKPSEMERAHIFDIVERLKASEKKRKSEFLDLLERAASDRKHGEDEDPPSGKYWYDIFPALRGLIEEQVELDADHHVERDLIVNFNWEDKKAIVAGSADRPGHILLSVEDPGADQHQFKVIYLGLEHEQEDTDGAQYVTMEHVCIASGPHVVARKEKQVVTLEKEDGKALSTEKGAFKRKRGVGAALPLFRRDKKAVSGDCIYEAVNKRLKGLAESEIDIQTFRNQVADTFTHNKNAYEAFLTEHDDEAEVAENLRTLGSWDNTAGDLTVTILANVLQRTIVVCTEGALDKLSNPEFPAGKSTITIQYNGTNHYW